MLFFNFDSRHIVRPGQHTTKTVCLVTGDKKGFPVIKSGNNQFEPENPVMII